MADQRSDKDAERIAEEAAGWVARLQSGDATAADHQRFDEWLQRDPAHREAYDEFRRLWGDLKDVPIPPDRLKKLKRARRRATIYRSTGAAVVLLLCATLYQMGFLDRLRADHYTSVGEVQAFALTDGTRVYLNTDTAIAVDFTDRERRIRILRGEAFFDVAKNAARPFVVDDGVLTATAIGTQYAVRSATRALDADVQVEEGKVEVRSADQQLLVEAGFAVNITARGAMTVSPSDVADATAWRNGRLIFSGRPLREVLATLGRYRHGRIVILDDAAAAQKVSGIFDLNDTDAALRELESSLPVTVTHLTDLLVVVGSRTP